MLRISVTIWLLLLALFQTGCSRQESGAPDSGNDNIAAIKEVAQKIIDASEAGDANGYLAHTTNDFLWHGTGSSPVRGSENVLQFLSEFFETSEFKLPEWATDEIAVTENIAIHRWSGVAEITPKSGGDSTYRDTRYLDVLTREAGGDWKVAIHTFEVVDPPSDVSDKINEAIAVIASHEAYAQRGDLDAVMSNVADDIVVLAYGVPLIAGKAAFRKFYGGLMSSGSQVFGHDYTGEEALGDDAVVLHGVSRGTFTTNEGDISEFSNNFVHILRRGDDGIFKIWRASFAPDAQAPLLGQDEETPTN